MKPISIFGLTILVLTVGFSIHQANAQILSNNVFFLEGSGFAVTENSIKNSQIDFAIATGSQSGSSISALIEDGFVTLNDDDYTVIDIKSTFLREGRYMRISGTAEGINGELAINFFGRLVEDSKEGSIYGFTGRITQNEISHKIIYTAKLSDFSKITQPTEAAKIIDKNTIYIMPGSSTQGLFGSYIEGGKALEESLKTQTQGDPLRIRYFSQDRLTIDPGTEITFVNKDSVSHSIVSGTGLGSNSRITGTPKICEPEAPLESGVSQRQTNCDFTLDGRINSGEILPGASVKVTFTDPGFYRIIDPDYHWMQITVYSFHNVDSLVIRGQN